jgi:OmpA-OmpF porin, OOP family
MAATFTRGQRIMNKLAGALVGSAVVTVLGAGAGSAQTPPGPYVNLGIGANYLQGATVTGPAFGSTTLNYNVGPVGVAAAGWALGNGLRAELEFGYRHSEAKNVTLPSGVTTTTSAGLNANVSTMSYMVNGLYDFSTGTPWSPHLGAGVGVANVRVNNIGHVTPFAFQAIAGIDYAISKNLRVGLDYRFLGTDSLNFNKGLPLTSRSNYYDHAVLLALRWSFGAPSPAPAAAAVPAVAPAPPPPRAETPPPAPQTFDVYFDFNKSTLTPAAHEIVRQAAAAAKQGATAHLNLVGHTDTVGSTNYNDALSLRRAEAVRAELVRDGVASDQIATSGRGESDLAVPTADNVRNPRNRRVVIVVQQPGT